MKEIKLTRGKTALVDDDDYERISKVKWCVTDGQKTFYAVRGTAIGKYKRRHVQMHREILGEPPFDGATVDHINGDGLDNRRANLRWCSHRQNCRNQPKRQSGANTYKGVSRDRWGKAWRAYIRHPETQKQTSLGVWPTEREAAEAYNRAAKEFHGEFASLNVF